jgi:outer membrane protein assembly factor BamB
MTTRSAALVLAGAVAACCAGAARAQDNPVYVDDSPAAWALFRQAMDHAAGNTAEAVRLFQELLDEDPLKLIPVNDAVNDHFTSTRQRVMDEVRRRPALLERYRLIESARAQRLLEAAALEELVSGRALTDAGLEGLLRLAQRSLERASFHAALAWLEEARAHPALRPEQALHCWWMTGMAAHFLGDTALLEQARGQLASSGPDGAARLERLRELDRGPQVTVGLTPLDRSEVLELSDLVAEEIWSVDLDAALINRRFSAPALPDRRPNRDMQRRSGDLQTAAATAAGSTIYVNQGHVVVALDRFTGRQLWLYVDRPRQAIVDREGDQTLDMNLITVEGDWLVTLTGHASADGPATASTVACLDARSGKPRWTATLQGLAEEDEQQELFAHGRPVIVDDAVYVLARKVTRQNLTSCYVVSLDLETGGIRWARHVASSAGLRRGGRPLSTLVHSGGFLHVATPVGAIASVRADTGQIAWLRRYTVPVTPSAHEQNRRPWEMPAPILTRERLIALQPGQPRVVVLDRRSGHQLASHAIESFEGWNLPRYLLADEQRLYAIGREIRAFDLEEMGQPLWSFPPPATSTEPAARGPRDSADIRGRVQLISGALIVPTLDAVRVLEAETGLTRSNIAVPSTGTPLALDAQLLLCSSDRLDAFMSLHRAEEMLRQRMAAAPADPSPSLSLVRLGARAHRVDLALEAARLALQTVESRLSGEAAAEARAELFKLLLQMDSTELIRSVETGQTLHALIGTVAQRPEQRIEHLLAYGSWLAQHAPPEAVATFQRLLDDAELAATWREESFIERPAGAWATQRMADLLRTHGPGLYGPAAAAAEAALQQAQSGPAPDPAALLRLARRFPFAPATVDATLLAARILAERGEHRAALGALVEVAAAAGPPAAPGRLLGAYVERALVPPLGWRETALDGLRHTVRRAGDALPLEGPGGPRPAGEWLAELAAQEPRLARLGAYPSNLEARALGGPLVIRQMASSRASAAGPMLVIEGRRLRQLDARLEQQWQATSESDAPLILLHDARRLLLWHGAEAGDPRAVMLDATTGVAVWRSPPLARHMGEPLAPRGPDEGGPAVDPADLLPLAAGQHLFIIRRGGSVLGLRLEDGSEPAWVEPRAIDQVHVAEAGEAALVLAGSMPRADALQGEAEPQGYIRVLDPATGRSIHWMGPLEGGPPQWIRQAPLGTLVYGNGEGITAIDLWTGRRRWTNRAFSAAESRRAWVAGDALVIEDRDNDLRSVRLADGALSPPFSLPHGDWDPLDIQEIVVVDRSVYALFRDRVVAFDEQGTIRGSDAIMTERRSFDRLLPVDGGLVLMSRTTHQAAALDRPGRRIQHDYVIYRLSRNCKVEGEYQLPTPMAHQLLEVRAVDGWLLLSSPADTLAVPMPPDARR